MSKKLAHLGITPTTGIYHCWRFDIMNFRPFLRAQLAQRLPTPVNFRERVALELDGFPEYESELTPDQLQKIDALARAIVRSNDTRDPIFEFRVEGHADVARRISNTAERRAQEQTISEQRAANGFNLLVKALKKNGGEQTADKVAKGSEAFGLGATRLKIPNASTEAQFRMNRRVVFIVRQVTFIPPPPEPPPPPSSVVEDRFSVQLIGAAILSLSPSPGVESVTVAATLAIVDRIDKKRVLYDVKATGGGLGGGPIPVVGGSLNLGEGPVVNFKTFRLLGHGASPIDLKSFEGAVTVFIDGGGGAGPLARGGTLSFSFDALESNGANTQPTVIRVPSDANSGFITPGISVGAVALGRMTMIGTPADL
jgi:outer membrane protein OmpA-like peptidoglycan-associated protein